MLARRDVLRYLLATPLAAVVDYERLLWVPGQQIVVPAGVQGITLAEMNAITMREIWPGIVDNFFQASPILRYFRDHPPQPIGRDVVRPLAVPW